VLLCGAGCCLWTRGFSGRRARPRGLVLTCGLARCPDAQLWLPTTNFACNSPATISNSEFTALKSQRFKALLNLHPIELHATFEEGQAPPPPTGTAASPCISCTPGTSGALHAGIVWSASMLHVIPLGLFRNLNCVRWYFNVSVCRRWGGPIELRAS